MMTRFTWSIAAAAVALLALAGCSSTDQGGDPNGSGDSSLKIAVVGHGPSGDPFWAAVKTGAEDAAAQTQVDLSYQSSDVLKEQVDAIGVAISNDVDGLIVSVPTVDGLRAPIDEARAQGISVVIINSGAADWKALGAIGYVGQDEAAAGADAGLAMKDTGVTSMLCVNITQVIQAVDQRCESASATFGGPVQTVRIDPSDTAGATAAIAAKLQADPSIDGVLSLGSGVFAQSAAGISSANSDAILGTFDLNEEIEAGIAEDAVAFAIDQQPYVQGYQSVITMALYLQNGLIIGGGLPVASGPSVVTNNTSN